MSQVYLCSATSWSDFHLVRNRWLKGSASPSIILLPGNWSSHQFKMIYDAPYAFTLPEFLELYIQNNSEQNCLLSRAMIR